MPFTKGIKNFFTRRKKPQSVLQASVASSARSSRPGPSPGEKFSVSQDTEFSSSSLLNPDRSEAELSRDSFLHEESIVEEVLVQEEETERLSAGAEHSSLEPSVSAPATTADANGSMPMASTTEKHVQYAGNRRDSGSTDQSVDEVSPLPSDRRQSLNSATTMGSDFNRDSPDVAASYNAIPLLEQTILPRGGISMDTQAVGRVQACFTLF